MPATESRKMRRALESAADLVIIDLEDSVPQAGKQAARSSMAATLSGGTGAQELSRPIAVRVNALRSRWFLDDVLAVADLGAVSGIVLPKVGSAADLCAVDAVLDSAEAAADRAHALRTYALIETAAGLAAAAEIARGSGRLAALILGYADLAVSLGRTPRESGDECWLPAQSAVVAAARAADRMVIDGPWLGVTDSDDFRAALRRGRDMGFDGAWVLHPAQIAAANTAFAPTADELARADRILREMERASAEGQGAVQSGGQMLDEAIVKWALRTLGRSGPAATPR